MMDKSLLPEMELPDKRALTLLDYKAHAKRLRKDPIYKASYIRALVREKKRRSNRWRRH